MTKRLVAAAVLMLTVAPALAAPSWEERNAWRLQTVAGPTKPGARLSYQAPKSEGVVSAQGAQQEESSAKNSQAAEKMACNCHRG